MNTKRKGSAKERELANYLWERGCAVLRGCSSGGGVRKRYVPDLVVICRGTVLVFEVKYRSKHTSIKIETEKLERLIEFAKRAGGKALLLIKYGRNPWKVLEIRDRVGRDEYEKAMDLRTFIESLFTAKLEDFIIKRDNERL
ncbi:holliday junction resolvase [Pyrobaculum islandicum DSM 4184]|uniref:Crossover junction endodeoxyribonuclease Hjc n=1 Tax=Pyrobaculum islandicum (strain DSM 4184 / JCM 9189 / GEO3) TaxID=384616 RepID=A1RSP9_PYRIL|nr:Holliday junction resolvase Hjc [Pyrobaculum islandicum]ABL87981.1 holliday junction resolvase [Pyrobaculum islandicum DSM 4184]